MPSSHTTHRRTRFLALILAVFSLAMATAASASTTPLKPPGQLLREVVDFLYSDVGNGGIRTYDNDPNGLPAPPYFYHFAIQHDNDLDSRLVGYPGYLSISYPAYTTCVAVDAFLDWWVYSGEQEALDRAVQMADWLWDRRTPPTDMYANWPYSTQTEGVMGGGFDGESIMSDKPAMFGLRCLRLHRITGQQRFLDAALMIADTYVATQMSGGVVDDGRWPFRVRPSDGLVIQDYTSHLIPVVRLLETLEASHPGRGYGNAASRAMAWIEANPMVFITPDSMHWEGFYEDVPPAEMIGEIDHYSAEETVEYLIDRNAPGDLTKAIDIMNWSTNRYLAPWSKENGYDAYAPVVLEWDHWPHSTYAATGQWAYMQLKLDEKTAGTPLNDPIWRQRAIEAFYTLTYGQGQFSPPNGDGRMLTTIRELTVPTFLPETWYEQNFNTVKYMLQAFSLAPELAPSNEAHLIAYDGAEPTSVQYTVDMITVSWDTAGTARFKLAGPPYGVLLGQGWIPQVSGGGPLDRSWRYDPVSQVLEVAHRGETLRVVLQANSATAVPTPRSPLRLGPAHPMPFNPRTVIPFTLTRAGNLRLSVVDAKGRVVRVLETGWWPAGPGQTVWDGTDHAGRPVASGAYRAVLQAGGGRVSAPLVLVR